jgi:hypothetical protein
MTVRLGPWRSFFALLLLAGCSGKPADYQRAPAEDRLYRIGKAYVQASHRLGRAPNSFEEIKANVEGDAGDDLLRSPRDGDKFVILWGVDYVKLPPGRDDPFTVGGYEKRGADGARYVLRFPLSVVKMSDEEFKKAVFPPGHKHPG